MNEDIKVVKTDEGNKDGQTKCPKCGATDITLDVNTGKLVCEFCRHTFEPEHVSGLETDLTKLTGEVIGSGASNIKADVSDTITLKCSSCGAEVVINTNESNNARCHWCRNYLSLNCQIENGAVPDVVLPFAITKNDAQKLIEEFVGKRNFFAHPKFKEEFTTNNIMGVYFPYMLVDANGHACFDGNGEHTKRRYSVKVGDHTEMRYDVDKYHVEREFDITVSGLSVESSKDKLDNTNHNKTNNVINAIMPFDTENCVKYDANYLKGYSSEKRDTNIDDLKDIVDTQLKDIARFGANESCELYDRGIHWDTENMNVIGKQWQAAYLPVWLYSYQQVDGDKKLLHYVAVNARTKETMGSVPIHMPKLIGVSAIVEFFSFLLMLFVDWDYKFLFLTFGVIFFLIMYFRYRNSNARHTYEKETKKNIANLRKTDAFLKTSHGESSASMIGANNKKVNGSALGSAFANLASSFNQSNENENTQNNQNEQK